MGIYINKGNEGFRRALNGEYVDKTGLAISQPDKEINGRKFSWLVSIMTVSRRLTPAR